MKRQPKKRPRLPTPAEQIAQNAIVEIVRTKLVALGDFRHLIVRRQDEHIVVAQPGPPEHPEDGDPVLRLTPIGGFRFGLSFRSPSGRWEKIPVSGVLANVLADAVVMLAPWLAPDPIISGTYGTDY